MTDTAICQVPRASGRDCSLCSSGQLVDWGTLIITLSEWEHCPLDETSDITYGWNEAGKVRKDGRWAGHDSCPRCPWDAASQHRSRPASSLAEGMLPTRVPAAAAFQPCGESPRQSNPCEGGGRESKQHCFWNHESINPMFTLLWALLPGWALPESSYQHCGRSLGISLNESACADVSKWTAAWPQNTHSLV